MATNQVKIKIRTASGYDLVNPETTMAAVSGLTSALATINTDISNKQDLLVSGSTIKTVNGNSLLGAGDIVTPKGVYYVEGNTTGTVGQWTATISEVAALYDGLTIRYRIGISGADPTYLNINGYGNKQVWRYAGAKHTTHWSVGTIVTLTYRATDGYWYNDADYDSTDDYNIRWQGNIIFGEATLGYHLLMEGIDGRFIPVTSGGDSASTTNTVSSAELRVGGLMLYYGASTDYAAGATGGAYGLYESIYSNEMEHWSNKASGWAVANKPFYIVCTMNANDNFVLDGAGTTGNQFLTQTLPTTDDGKYYIQVGVMHNTYDTWRLDVAHPIYQFKDGKLRTYVPTHIHTFAELSSKPTTLAGYGITDARTATQITTEITQAVSALVDSSPSTLNTLNELAAALGNDPNFATTLSTQIGTKVTGNTAITAATKTKITYDAKGLVTGGADLTPADIPALDWAKITSGKPTTLAGYGITNAMSTSHYANNLNYLSIPLGVALTDGITWNDTTKQLYVKKNGTECEILDSNNISSMASTIGLALTTDLDYYVPTTRTINGYALNGNISLGKSDIGLGNVPNTDATNPANITQSASYRFVTDTEKATWNAKQAALSAGTQLEIETGTQTAQRTWSPKILKDAIQSLSDINTVTSVAGKTGAVTLVKADITDFPSSMPASDVYSWAKQANKPTYNASEVGGLGANYRWLTDAYINAWNAKEPAITKGNVTQYFRGDMSLAVFPSSLPASDVYSWAKQANKPSYNQDEVADGATYKRVTQTEKNNWNGKPDYTDVTNAIYDYDTSQFTPALALKVSTSRLIAGINLIDDITVAELTAVLNEATTVLKGLMSPTDKSRLDTLYALLNDSTDGSADTVVDNIQEVLAIFNSYPEGASIVTALANKLETSEVTETATASKVAKRNSSGDLFARLFRSEYSSLSTTPNYIMVQHALGAGADNYIRPLALSQLKTSLGSMPASDVYAWAKAATKPSYAWSEITSKPTTFAPIIGSGAGDAVAGNDSRLTNSRPASDVYAWAKAASKPAYTQDEVTNGSTYKRVTQTEKDAWNKKYSEVPAFKTAAFTFVLGEANQFIVANFSTNLSCTIPTNASVAFPIGTELHIIRYHDGEVTIAAASGVTIVSEGSKRRINAKYQVVTAKKIGTDLWILFGALKT